ncbi:hypothetical protein [Rhodococcus sp. X156]|nr:hypothetical protein [Rhodococcus sp. X156]
MTLNVVAGQAFPAKWGGPNFLAGLIQLVAYLVALTGVVLVLVGIRRR